MSAYANAYAVSLSKYVNTGLFALFTILSYAGFLIRGRVSRRAVEIIQQLLLAAFLANGNITIAWFVRKNGQSGAAARNLCLLCAMEILFLISFMVLYRIVHEMADMALFNNICMLLSVGFVIIARIALYNGSELQKNEPIKQFVIASAGLLIMLIIPFFRKIFDSMRHLWLIFGGIGIVSLAGVLLLSQATNGAMITYTLAGFTFQPSEFVKILFILMLAGLLSGEVTVGRALVASGASLVHVGILVLPRDLGSALIFFVVFLMMLFLASGRWSVIFTGLVLGALGSIFCYRRFYHVMIRIMVWRDPFALIQNEGFQIAQSLFAISYGGPWGAGLTQGAPDRIPFVESDFIVSAIIEEMGMVFGVLLLLVCINCFLRILMLSASYSNRFFQLFTYGAGVCYIFQTFLTVGGETKFIPLTGVTFPLVSYGGSSVLSTLIMLGIVQMVFILHEERTAQFMERYELEHSGEGFSGPLEMSGSQDFGSGDYSGSEGDASGGYAGYGPAEGPSYSFKEEDLPENFPVNGVSEEGIFDDYSGTYDYEDRDLSEEGHPETDRFGFYHAGRLRD